MENPNRLGRHCLQNHDRIGPDLERRHFGIRYGVDGRRSSAGYRGIPQTRAQYYEVWHPQEEQGVYFGIFEHLRNRYPEVVRKGSTEEQEVRDYLRYTKNLPAAVYESPLILTGSL